MELDESIDETYYCDFNKSALTAKVHKKCGGSDSSCYKCGKDLRGSRNTAVCCPGCRRDGCLVCGGKLYSGDNVTVYTCGSCATRDCVECGEELDS